MTECGHRWTTDPHRRCQRCGIYERETPPVLKVGDAVPLSPPRRKLETLFAGDRVRKRGLGFEGGVERVTEIGVRVAWDDGPSPRERPLYCTAGELERIISQ